MTLLRAIDLEYGLDGATLLDRVSFALDAGERVCLIGRNGAGKSTLLRIIAGELQADGGELMRRQGLRVAQVAQEVPEGTDGSVFDLVADALGELAGLLRDYHQASLALAQDGSEAALARLERVQHELEAQGAWALERRVEATLSRLGLEPDIAFAALSGGLKRRVLLARALVTDPELLLLDEPTNHLDIDAIAWLEEFLIGFPGALLFVTHDRMFLQRVATRILELDRGALGDWPGDYANFLRRKEERLSAEAKANERFDKRLAEEEVWIRQGIKARRTRNEGRVRALQTMREERRARREQLGNVRLSLDEAERSGRRVIEAVGVGYSWDGKTIVRDFDCTILRGDRVGIIGPNGSGKTTLLNLLLGRLPPDRGEVRHGTRLQVAYFDQMRAQLDPELSVRDNVGGGSDRVTVGGGSRHVMSYLQDFLFTPRRARAAVKSLSGGERNRVLLARLFTQPANLLVLDEPTNDLDAETLELLEELLGDYQGTLLLVSHDRAFLDNVVTSTLVLEGGGRVGDYVGGYSDWLRQRALSTPAEPARVVKPEAPRPSKRVGKLSYNDQRELDALPARIEALEEALSALQQRLADPALYREGGDQVAELRERLAAAEQALATAFERWELLEARRSAG